MSLRICTQHMDSMDCPASKLRIRDGVSVGSIDFENRIGSLGVDGLFCENKQGSFCFRSCQLTYVPSVRYVLLENNHIYSIEGSYFGPCYHSTITSILVGQFFPNCYLATLTSPHHPLKFLVCHRQNVLCVTP